MARILVVGVGQVQEEVAVEKGVGIWRFVWLWLVASWRQLALVKEVLAVQEGFGWVESVVVAEGLGKARGTRILKARDKRSEVVKWKDWRCGRRWWLF